MAEMIKNIHVL